jgi:hypothetical protein
MYVCVVFDMIVWYAQFSATVVHWSTMTAWYTRFCAGSTGLVNDMTTQYAHFSVRVSTDLANGMTA